MASIIFFTYDRQIDRRGLLQCESLIAAGHSVTLYAAPHRSAVADPTYVRRLPAPAPSAGAYASALACKAWLTRHFPRLTERLQPALRALFWQCYARLMPHRAHGGIELAFLKLYDELLASPLPADLYIAHDLPMLPVALAAKKRYGGHVLYDSHELYPFQEFTPPEQRMWEKLERRFIHQTDTIVTINPSVANDMQQRYGVQGIEVIYNADWLPELSLPPQKIFHEILALPPTARIVLFQGRLSAGRNLTAIVNAMQYVPDERVHLVFLGDGPLAATLQKQARTLMLEARVHVLPAVEQSRLLSYTAAADVGIIPYTDTCLNNRYCTPNKLFEFIAAGIPILGSDLVEIRRLLETHGCGLVTDMRHPRHIADMITRIFVADTLQALRASTAVARQTLCWQREGERFVAMVERTLAMTLTLAENA